MILSPDGGCAGSFQRRRVIFTVFSMTRAISTPDAFLPERWLNNGPPEGEHNTGARSGMADDLHGKELGVYGDVHAALLDAATLSLLKGPGVCL